MIKTTLQALIVAAAACLAAPAMAADVAASAPLTKEQAHDMKIQSKANYEASKKVADANKELDVADCKTSDLNSKQEHDCKKTAKATAKESKKHAKESYKEDKADIKARTQ